jgi:hypothetical protein
MWLIIQKASSGVLVIVKLNIKMSKTRRLFAKVIECDRKGITNNMGKQDTRLIKEIVSEYMGFVKRTSVLVDEVKRATVISLKKVLKLEDGDSITVNEDGSLEIETKENYKENVMPEKKDENQEKLTLNGRDVTAEELQRQREAAQNQKGTRLEEVSKGNFRLRLDD